MRHRVTLVVLVCATLLSAHPALAQFSQQGPKLVGTGAVGNAQQGQSVSVSADGNTAIVGGSGDNSNVGAAWIWTRSGGVWTPQGAKLVGSGAVGNANQGVSVSLSADGNTAIVGGNADNSNAGAAWVWTRNAGVWTPQGTKLVGGGSSVSLSADGNTAIIGGSGGNVWTRSGGVWTQQGTLGAGYPVSISGDGNTAIVGGIENYPSIVVGYAYVWTRSGGVWTQQATETVRWRNAPNTPHQQGISMSLSGDGNTDIFGWWSTISSGLGSAWVWTRSGGVWTQQATNLVGSGAVGNAYQGYSVSLSADGNTAIVGGYGDNTNVGAAWVFTNSAPVVIPPTITTQPVSQFIQASSNVTFSVLVNGQSPLNYQWHNGTGIVANATNSNLTITNAQADASYYVVVSNSYGSVTSQSAQLKILVNYTTAIPTPLSPTPPPPPPKPPSQHNLVVVTHGWQPIGIPQWVYDMTNSIINNLPDSSWTVFALSWNGSGGAGTLYPSQAASRAEIIGKKFGLGISAQGWSHVHFIGHSAGAVLIQAAAEELRANSASPVVIHTTFLDPYDWSFFGGPSRFGAGSDWSDNYFESDITGPLTGGRLDNSYNVDISGIDPHIFGAHVWAYEFYQKTVTSLPIIYEGLGFTLSKEGGNWDYAINNYHPGNSPYLLGGGSTLCSSAVPVRSNPNLVVSALTSLWNGSVYVTFNGFDLFTSLFSPLNVKPLTPTPHANTFGSPVWLSLGIAVTNRINFVTFDARFTSATNAAGLLTVYWNTNEIGVADETVTTPGLQNYSFSLPATYSSGNYVLGFRLDSFTNIVSSISITNVSLGFAGLTNTVTLGISRAGGSNQLTLTGPSNYNYLVESSSNLVDWIPTAIVANTNGTVLFPIPASTNSNAQFYRAVSP